MSDHMQHLIAQQSMKQQSDQNSSSSGVATSTPCIAENFNSTIKPTSKMGIEAIMEDSLNIPVKSIEEIAKLQGIDPVRDAMLAINHKTFNLEGYGAQEYKALNGIELGTAVSVEQGLNIAPPPSIIQGYQKPGQQAM